MRRRDASRAFVDDIVRRAFVDDSHSPRCVGGMCRARSSTTSCVARSSTIRLRRDASEGCVARVRRRFAFGGMRRAFVDDSPSLRCVGSPSSAASTRRTHWRIAVVVVRRRVKKGKGKGRGGGDRQIDAGGGGARSWRRRFRFLLLFILVVVSSSDGWRKPKQEGMTTEWRILVVFVVVVVLNSRHLEERRSCHHHHRNYDNNQQEIEEEETEEEEEQIRQSKRWKACHAHGVRALSSPLCRATKNVDCWGPPRRLFLSPSLSRPGVVIA